MAPRRTRALAAALIALLLAGCARAPAAPLEDAERARLGLMTSLPLYWPLGAGVEQIASGRAAVPWQRTALEEAYELAPLDTLAPIPGLAPDAPESDPLAGLTRLAVIQPRGLSPADNVALDGWVRGGGRLLLVLDPALTGDYDLPLGDPRRPVDTALIPPVVARWGLAISFDEREAPELRHARLGEASLPLALAGRITLGKAARGCTLTAAGAAARCRIGKGRAVLLADAALFEHGELAGEGGAALRALIAEALE